MPREQEKCGTNRREQGPEADAFDASESFSTPIFSVLKAAIVAIAACTWWNTVERIRARLDKGHVCIVLKNGGRIAGYTWADLAEVNNSACDYALDPDEAYLYDGSPCPSCAGASLHPT